VPNYSRQLEKNFEEIGKLIETPEAIRDFAINYIQNLDRDTDLTNTGKVKIKNIISSLENISEQTIKNNYQIIYNQICVLAVSSLSATLEKYFTNLIQAIWRDVEYPEKFKLTLQELKKYDFKLKPALGYIILEKDNSINFQDLKSTLRTFGEYCNKKISLDKKTFDDIIFYQQCRHLLVHKNGIVDKEFLERTKNKKYKIGDKIQLGKDNWVLIKKSFLKLIEKITGKKGNDF